MSDDFIGRPLGDAARHAAEQNELRRTYDYLFAAERDRLTAEVNRLRADSRELTKQVESLTLKAARLEDDLANAVKKSKPYNRVVFDLKATVAGDAATVLHTMAAMYGRARGGSIRLTHGEVDANTLHVWIEYDVCGGHPADMRRMLAKVLKSAGSVLVEDPTIAVVSRTRLTDDGEPISPV